MNINKDEIKKDCKIIGVFLLVVFVLISLFCIHKCISERANINHYNDTIQQAQYANDTAKRSAARASEQISDTQTELYNGQADITRASESVERLQQSADNSTKQLDECQQQLKDCQRSLDEQQSLLNEIATANGFTN